MTTFKQKALEALKKMELPSNSGFGFGSIDQHNQTVRDCIGRIEAIEEELVWVNVEERLPEEIEEVIMQMDDGFIQQGHIDGEDWYKHTSNTSIQFCESPRFWMKKREIYNL